VWKNSHVRHQRVKIQSTQSIREEIQQRLQFVSFITSFDNSLTIYKIWFTNVILCTVCVYFFIIIFICFFSFNSGGIL